MPFPSIPTQIRCPQCSTAFTVDVRTIIDVGQEPELKQQLLRGELNHAQCPQCGAGGTLATWLVYHDPAKALLISYVPSEMGLSADEQERVVGRLLNTVMNETPAEDRKAYFLQPKSVLTYDGLIESVLEAEGITKDVLERHRGLIELIDSLLDAMNSDEDFDRLADENSGRMDYEFYLLLAQLIEAQGDQAEGNAPLLNELRERLLTRAQPTAASPEPTSVDQLIDELLENVGSPEWEDTVSDYLPALDYAFFQALTARIEAAESGDGKADAASLGALREALLDYMDRRSRELREAEDEASLLIMELLESDDLEQTVRERLDDLDDVFFMVLARLRQTAASRGNEARASRLSALLDTARDVREEALPPEIRLVSRLLRADYPGGSGQLLEQNRGLVNTALLNTYDRYIAQSGEGSTQEARERLDSIRGQIAAKIEVARL